MRLVVFLLKQMYMGGLRTQTEAASASLTKTLVLRAEGGSLLALILREGLPLRSGKHHQVVLAST
jgi:hypothetical protein